MPKFELLFKTETISKGTVYFSDLSQAKSFIQYLLDHYCEIDLLFKHIK